jgi:hypothetical protein
MKLINLIKKDGLIKVLLQTNLSLNHMEVDLNQQKLDILREINKRIDFKLVLWDMVKLDHRKVQLLNL